MTKKHRISREFLEKQRPLLKEAALRSNLEDGVAVVPVSLQKFPKGDFVAVSQIGFEEKVFSRAYRGGAKKVIAFTSDVEELINRLNS